MAIDWEAEVGAPTVAVFGGPAIYSPADGSASFAVNGVFDAAYREVTVIDGLSYTSDYQPVIGINAAQFGIRAPIQNDRVMITDPVSPHFGKTYIVREPKPDSHGIIKLMLMEYVAP